MKTLNQYIQEKLIINKDYRGAKIYTNKIVVKSFDELRNIIEDRYKKLGPGTKQNPVDFNDIDVSNIDSFCNKYNIGIFEYTRFKYIDISYWNVSNVKSMSYMFAYCEKLKSCGNLLKWNVSNVTDMSSMFNSCKNFNQDLSKWDVSNVTSMSFMFENCKSFNQDISSWNVSNVIDMSGLFYGCESFNQDISGWDVSNVTDMAFMFYKCESFNQDISNWNVSNVTNMYHIFYYCSIKNEYKPKFK